MATRLLAVVAVGLILVGVLMAQYALAQPQCGARAQMTAELANGFQEAQQAIGVTSTGAVIELWATDSGSTFTLLVTMPTGLACVIAVGETWQTIHPISRGTHL